MMPALFILAQIKDQIIRVNGKRIKRVVKRLE